MFSYQLNLLGHFQCVGQNQSISLLGGSSSILRTSRAGPVKKHPVDTQNLAWTNLSELRTLGAGALYQSQKTHCRNKNAFVICNSNLWRGGFQPLPQSIS